MIRPIYHTMNEFLASLSVADIHPETVEQANKRLKLIISEFELRDENRVEGGKAVRKGPRKRVRTTLKHLIRATKDAKRGDRSLISQKARVLLRAIRTFQNFEALEEKARGFAGFRWKETRRQNQRKIRERAPSIAIETSLVLRQLATVDDLRSVSLMLRLCAHDPDWGYLEALRDRSQDFWVIQRNDDPIALLAIDRDGNKVSEADGFDHEPIGLSRLVMLEVLRGLRASADDCKSFSSVGAYSLFLRETVPHPTSIECDDSVYRVWGADGEVIISRDEHHWSQFRWDDEEGGWEAGSGNDIRLGGLVDLLSCCPNLAEVIREYRLPQVSESSPDNRRRPRRRWPRALRPSRRERRGRG